MKVYVRSDVRVKKTSGIESPEIHKYLENDYEGHTITFLGEYQDYRGRRAYKYRIEHPEYDTTTVYVVSTDWQYDMSDTFDDIAKYPDDSSSLPRMPKSAPANGWPPCKTIKVLDRYGDKQEFESIRSRDGAIKFLYGQLSNANFPMMHPMQYRGDAEYYTELMLGFDNEPQDEDSHTYFTTQDGTTYCIDSEIDLKKAIQIYYAIPYVESILHGDASCSVVFNGCVWRDDEGYWYDGDREHTFDAGEAKYGKGNYIEI